jgi:hypothetical protein
MKSASFKIENIMKKRGELLAYLFLLSGGFFIAFGFQNCVQAPKPGHVATLSSIGAIVHTGKEMSCSPCHETGPSGRPSSTAGFLNLNPNIPFDYATHAAGTDCIACHNMSRIARTKADWGNGNFNHTATQTSCISCHSSEKPINSAGDLLRTGNFDHTTIGGQDCFSCHASSLQTSFSSLANWSGGSGQPIGLKWDIAKDMTIAGQVPNFSATTITSLSAQSQTLHMMMNHGSSQITPQVISNCTTCHVGGIYTGGVFHTSLTAASLAQPKACNDCHNSSVLPVGFVGPAVPAPFSARSPSSNEMRHEAVVWSKNNLGNFVTTPTKLIGNDCILCHSAPTAVPTGGNNGWNAALYHSSLSAASLTQPSSCLDCHANSRTIGSNTGTLTAFDHSTNANGVGDCVSCHTSHTTWVGGVFHQNGLPAPSTCNACHSSQRPNGTQIIGSGGGSFNFVGYNSGVLPFDTSSAQNASGYHGGARDCNSCHTPALFNLMSNWSGGNFNHAAAYSAGQLTSCQDCHTSQRPTSPITVTALNGLSATFDHSKDGLGDCIACHTPTITRGVYANYQTSYPGTYGDTDWRGAQTYNKNGLMGPDPTKALTTVSATQLNYSNQANFQVASTTTLNETLSDQMSHVSAQIPATLWNGSAVGNPTGLDQTKCGTCHFNLPLKYAGSTFHATATPAGPSAVASLTSCTECHVNTTPHNIVSTALMPMDHAANLSGGAVLAADCISCHTKTTAGTSFSGATFHANIGTQSASTCTTCHYLTAPTGNFVFAGHSAQTSGFKHSSSFAPGDCNACHNLTNPQIKSLIASNGKVSTNFSGANFHKNETPSSLTSCVDCHIKPTVNPKVSAIDAQHMSHASSSVPNDCVACHISDLSAGVTPTLWSTSSGFHAGTNSNTSKSGTVIGSCQECHGLTNGGGATAGTNNDLPAALVSSTTLSTFPNGNSTIFDQIDHRAPSVVGKDCNLCHTNIGATGPKWKSAKFHAIVSVTGSSTACETCHANVQPSGLANGEMHSDGAHNTCGSCHTNPAGTGSIGSTSNPPNWLGAAGGMPATVTLTAPSASGWSNLTMPHPTPASGVTCAMCHGASIGKTLIGWDHDNASLVNNTTYCAYCHLSGQANIASAGISGYTTVSKNHQGTTIAPNNDCANCHFPGRWGFAWPTRFQHNGMFHD